MSFAGDLADYPLPELLFFLSSKNRSGWLTLCYDTSEITFTLLHGRPIAAQSSDTDQRLGARLVADGAVTRARIQLALAHQRLRDPQPALGELLVDLGYLDSETVQRVMHEQICALLFQLLIRPTGQFSYVRGLPDLRGIDLDLTMEREVLAAIGRADEWFTEHIPRARLCVEPDVTPDMLVGAIEVDWPLFEALLDGAASVDDLLAASGWGRSEVVAGVSRLQAQGVLRIDTTTSNSVDDPTGGVALAG
jgi:hypothetical protein